MIGGDIGERANAAGLIVCWSCKGPVSALAQFCHTCGAIQGPGQADHFRRLGLPHRFDIDDDILERRYIGFQRHLHPDRFVGKSAKERALAEAQAVSLNQAYETLKDPLRRAAYLLRLKGGNASIDMDQTIDDQSLLMEIMELRESLAASSDRKAVEGLASGVGAQAIGLLTAISAAFHGENLEQVNRLVTRLKYLRKFLEETRARIATTFENV